MKSYPDKGMYSIKLVHPGHLDHSFFTPDTANDGEPRLMNFSDRGTTPARAARICPGHKAIVYVTSPVKKFIWAIEYIGTLQDGAKAALDHPIPPGVMPAEFTKTLAGPHTCVPPKFAVPALTNVPFIVSVPAV